MHNNETMQKWWFIQEPTIATSLGDINHKIVLPPGKNPRFLHSSFPKLSESVTETLALAEPFAVARDHPEPLRESLELRIDE
jgi:hypothetical protein